MPARIGRERESKIIRLYLRGVSEAVIAQEAGVSQSTVSQVISRFKADASKTSLDAASKKWVVSDEIDELRSLSVDLRKAKIHVNAAKMGSRLYEELKRIGGDLDNLGSLLAVYERIAPKEFPVQDFVKATVKMIQLEKESGMDYKNVLSNYMEKQAKLKEMDEKIRERAGELDVIVRKKAEANASLGKYLEEKRLTLQKVEKAIQIEVNLEKAGLNIEKGEPVGDMLRIFSDLIQEKGMTLHAAAAELQKFLIDAKNLEEARHKVQDEVKRLEVTRASLHEEVKGLESDKTRLTVDNKFLKEGIENILELREKHGIGVDEISRIRSLAQKYGPSASILQSLDTYKSLGEIEDRKSAVESSVEELTQRETSLKSKIKTVEEELVALPGKIDESIAGVKSTIARLSDEVERLGEAVKNGSNEVVELKNRALDAGREISAAESQVKSYKLTSRLIDLMTKGEGEEAEVVVVTTGFLMRLSEWVNSHPKYSEMKQQIESLRNGIERQLMLG